MFFIAGIPIAEFQSSNKSILELQLILKNLLIIYATYWYWNLQEGTNQPDFHCTISFQRRNASCNNVHWRFGAMVILKKDQADMN
nr:hypothetical protein Iba_chr06bCG12690 [Ipomoea batatas]